MIEGNNEVTNNKIETTIRVIRKKVTTKTVNKRVATIRSDTPMIVNPSVTEGRRWVRTLIKGTQVARTAIAITKTIEQARSFTTTGKHKIAKRQMIIITISDHTIKNEQK